MLNIRWIFDFDTNFNDFLVFILELECRFRKLKNGSRIIILKLMFKLVQELRPLWLMDS